MQICPTNKPPTPQPHTTGICCPIVQFPNQGRWFSTCESYINATSWMLCCFRGKETPFCWYPIIYNGLWFTISRKAKNYKNMGKYAFVAWKTTSNFRGIYSHIQITFLQYFILYNSLSLSGILLYLNDDIKTLYQEILTIHGWFGLELNIPTRENNYNCRLPCREANGLVFDKRIKWMKLPPTFNWALKTGVNIK